MLQHHLPTLGHRPAARLSDGVDALEPLGHRLVVVAVPVQRARDRRAAGAAVPLLDGLDLRVSLGRRDRPEALLAAIAFGSSRRFRTTTREVLKRFLS